MSACDYTHETAGERFGKGHADAVAILAAFSRQSGRLRESGCSGEDGRGRALSSRP